MLYDILPPMLFFASLGGVIAVVSRVVLRIRRQQTSHAIQMEGAVSQHQPEQLIHSGTKGVNLVTNRVALLGTMFRQAGQSMASVMRRAFSWRPRRSRPAVISDTPASTTVADEPLPITQEESAEVGIIKPPSSGLRHRVGGLFSGMRSRVGQTTQAVRDARLRRAESAATPAEELFGQEQTEEPAPIRMTRIEVAPQPTVTEVSAEEAISPDDGGEPALPPEETPVSPEPELEDQTGLMAQFRKKRSPKQTVLQQAEDAVKAGQYAAAEDILVPYIVEHTKSSRAYLLLGKVALARSEWEEAIEIFEQAVRLNGNDARMQASLGYAYLKAGRMTRALEALQRAHDADGSNKFVLRNLLFIAQRMDNKVLQHSILEELVALEPDKEEYAEALQALEQQSARV